MGDAVGVLAEGGGDLFVYGGLVGFGGELDEKVAGVDGEEGGKEVRVGDLLGVHRVAVSSRAGVDANVDTLRGGEAVEDSEVI